jgi:methionyl-tRNA formyltransferase (EC 2.1.2.9)
MKIVFMGTPSFALPSLEELLKHFEVVGVITQQTNLRVGDKSLHLHR